MKKSVVRSDIVDFVFEDPKIRESGMSKEEVAIIVFKLIDKLQSSIMELDAD